MKLLMISGDRLAAAGKQGAFWYTLEALSAHWKRIDVLCPKIRDTGYGIRDTGLNNVYFHPCPKGLWYQAAWVRKKGAELLQEYKHDVCTSHDYPPFYNAKAARTLQKKYGVPVVSEVHHIVGWPKAASASELIGRIWSRISLPNFAKYTTAVRVVNSTVKNILLQWGIPEEKLHVVPSFYLDSTQLQPKECNKQFDILFVGRLVANKGFDKLLVALSKLAGASLVVIGDGSQRKHYQQLAKNIGVADQVQFLGWLPAQKDVIDYLQKARVFVLPSTSEGGPRSALEAMACGVPVVTTAVGVMPDVIRNGENGLFTTGKPDDIAEKVALLLSDDEWRKKMGKEAAAIRQKYDRKLLIQQYAEFLQSFAV